MGKRRLIFTANAREDIKQIRSYYKQFPKRRSSILSHINAGMELLEKFPLAGSVLDIINDSPVEYRSLVIDKHYKLIYSSVKERIYVFSVWDCRKNPLQLFDILH